MDHPLRSQSRSEEGSENVQDPAPATGFSNLEDVLDPATSTIHLMDTQECYATIQKIVAVPWGERKPLSWYINAFLECLKKCPAAASEQLKGPPESIYNNKGHLPLFYLVRSKAPLEAIQMVYDMFPRALELDSADKNSIIYHACLWSGDYEDVIGYLITQYPHCLRRLYKETISSPGYMPIHIIMGPKTIRGQQTGRPASLQLIQKLVQLCPSSIRIRDNKQRTPLHYAIYDGHDQSVVDFILTKMPNHISELSLFGHTCHPYYTFDMSSARNLGMVLRRVERFQCTSIPWTDNALDYILQALQCESPRLQSLHLKIPAETLCRRPEVSMAIKDVLIRNQSIKRFVFSAAQKWRIAAEGMEHYWCDDFLQNLALGLQMNHNIETLQLNNMNIQDGAVLMNLLQPELSIQSLRLQEIRVLDTFAAPSNKLDLREAPPQLQSLELVLCILPFEYMALLLRQISVSSTLKRLLLSHVRTTEEQELEPVKEHPRFNITGPIIEILQKGCLEKLEILSITPRLSIQPVCDVLERNKTLKTYYIQEDYPQEDEKDSLRYVLECHNTTLEKVNARGDPEIMYYIHLNQHGRKKTRDERTTKEDFVELLSQVVKKADDLEKQHSLLHGLLKESHPSLWCEVGPSLSSHDGKRRRL